MGKKQIVRKRQIQMTVMNLTKKTRMTVMMNPVMMNPVMMSH